MKGNPGTKLRVESFTISLDGFGAGPDRDLNNPLGVGATGDSRCPVATSPLRNYSRVARKKSILRGALDQLPGDSMKMIAVILLAMTVMSPGVAVAEPVTSSPLFGSWAVDISRLPMPPQARPRSVTITFSSERDGQLGTRVDVVDPNGERLHAEGVTPLDGAPTPVTASWEADVSATTMPVPEVLIMQLAKDGVPASTRIYTVAADGKSMTETVAYFGEDGQPVLRRNFFSRIQ